MLLATTDSTRDRVLGRERELSALTTFLDGIASGPAVLLITGDAGFGKTTLWTAGTFEARQRSYHVLTASPAEPESGLSFSVLGDLLAGVGEKVISELPGIQRSALRAALLRGEEPAIPPDPRTVAVAVLNLLRVLAGSAPVIVSIDDLQWIDRPSARILHFAARRLGSAPVGMVCALRSDGAPQKPPVLWAGTSDVKVATLTVGALGTEPLRQVIRRNLGTSLPRSTLAKIHRASGGNPFYAIEIARTLGEGASLSPGEPIPIPQDLHRLLESRLAELAPRTRETVLAASILSRPTPDLLRAVLRRSTDSGLASARTAGVIEQAAGEIRLTHPLLAAAVYEAAGPQKRRRLHRRAAEVVSDPEERARHLAAITTPPKAEVAEALDVAADAALRRGAPDSAAELREQASTFTPAGRIDDVRRRGVDAAQHHLAAGDLGRARELLESWREKTPPGPARAEILRLLGELHFYSDSFLEAAAALDEARAGAGEDPGVRAPIEVDTGMVLTQIGDVQSAAAHAGEGKKQAALSGNPWLIAQSLAGSAILDFVLGRPIARADLERAVALEESMPGVPWLASPTLLLALIEMWLGHLEEARSAFARAYSVLQENGDEVSVPVLAGLWGGAAQAECWSGDLDAAWSYAEAAMNAADQLGSSVARGLALSAVSCVEAYRGEPEATRKAAEESNTLLQNAGVSALCLWPLGMIGFVELSRGQPAAAAETLRDIAEMVPSVGVGEPACTPFVPDAVEALLGVGDLERATQVTDWLQERANALGRPWTVSVAARCQGIVRAAEGDSDGAVSSLEQAVVAHERGVMPVERARTLLAKGMVHRRRREKRAAKETLTEALNTFERAGARLWLERAQDELRRVGLRAPAPLALTATEESVARLAAEGATTQEIAQQLFMSPKTVESVITRIYRKLGVRSRAALSTRLSKGVPAGGRQ